MANRVARQQRSVKPDDRDTRPDTRKAVKGGGKPSKPYPDFPLFPHQTKRWAKKIRGRICYFGSWADGPEAALKKYLEQRDDLHAGRTPQPEADDLTVRDLVNRFPTGKRAKLESGELKPQTFRDYHSHCARVVSAFGRQRPVDDLTAADFDGLRRSVAKTCGPVGVSNVVQGVRSVFKFGFEAGLIDKPVRFGPNFVKPTRRVLRLDRQSKPAKVFSAAGVSTRPGSTGSRATSATICRRGIACRVVHVVQGNRLAGASLDSVVLTCRQ